MEHISWLLTLEVKTLLKRRNSSCSYIEGMSYYLAIKLENFKGNIDIIAE